MSSYYPPTINYSSLDFPSERKINKIVVRSLAKFDRENCDSQESRKCRGCNRSKCSCKPVCGKCNEYVCVCRVSISVCGKCRQESCQCNWYPIKESNHSHGSLELKPPLYQREKYYIEEPRYNDNVIIRECGNNILIKKKCDNDQVLTPMATTLFFAINPTTVVTIPSAVPAAPQEVVLTGWTLQSNTIIRTFNEINGILDFREPGDYQILAVFQYVVNPINASIPPPANGQVSSIPYIALHDFRNNIDIDAKFLSFGPGAMVNVGLVVFNSVVTVRCGDQFRFRFVNPTGGIFFDPGVGGVPTTITFNNINAKTTLAAYKIRDTPGIIIQP